MKSRFFVVLISLFLFPLALARADPPDSRKPAPEPDKPVVHEEIVVTASALPEATGEVPAAVTIIDREQIERQHALDLADVLREVPGITIASFGSSGKAASLFTRGANSSHTLVLWNGIEINNPYFSGYDWGQFSTSGVDRVEVVRGPFSALYGSDAMSGVINVITTPDSSGWSTEIRSGERGLLNGRFSGSGNVGPFMAEASLEHRQDDGWFPNDDLRQSTATAGFRWTGSPRFTAGIFARINDYELGVPFNDLGGPELVATVHRRQSGTESQLSLPLTAVSGGTSWELTLSRAAHSIDIEDPEDPFGLQTQSTESVAHRAHAQASRVTPLGTLVFGGEYERSRVDDQTTFGSNLDGEIRQSRSWFAEDRFGRNAGTGRLEISAGARWDDFDTFGSRLSPRLAAAWIRGSHKWRTAWGEAFRAPSVGELYYPFSGNRDLDPETSRSWELGYDLIRPRMEVSVTAFHADYQGLIVFDNASYTFQNIGNASSRGVELGINGPLAAGLTGGLSWTWLETHQNETDQALLRRPKNSGSAHLEASRGRLNGSLVISHTGARADILPVFPYDRVTDQAHTIVKITAGLNLERFSPWIEIDNLLNETYQEIRGFPAPGRRAVVGLRYSR